MTLKFISGYLVFGIMAVGCQSSAVSGRLVGWRDWLEKMVFLPSIEKKEVFAPIYSSICQHILITYYNQLKKNELFSNDI